MDEEKHIRYSQPCGLTEFSSKKKALFMRSALAPTGLALLVPCHNCADFLAQCIDSLLTQDFTQWRLVIADDASTDTTVHKALTYKDPRITVLQGSPRAYLMGNIWAGLKKLAPAANEVVAIIDGDDYLLPTALSTIMQAHTRGYDFVFTDMELSNGQPSLGAPPCTGVSPREQLWSFSHLRSFKGYLLNFLEKHDVQDQTGNFFRAAGDLSLYFPLAELAGPAKTLFLPHKLYHYRVHDQCNFLVRRQEQLENNWLLRARPAKKQQTQFFDFTEQVVAPEKMHLRALGRAVRKRYPLPFSIKLEHSVETDELDSRRAYHNLWIEEGIFFSPKVRTNNAR